MNIGVGNTQPCTQMINIKLKDDMQQLIKTCSILWNPLLVFWLDVSFKNIHWHTNIIRSNMMVVL